MLLRFFWVFYDTYPTLVSSFYGVFVRNVRRERRSGVFLSETAETESRCIFIVPQLDHYMCTILRIARRLIVFKSSIQDQSNGVAIIS